jgi:hypothetical protein
VLGIASTALAGGVAIDSIADLDQVAAELNTSFEGGLPNGWAQDHLVKDSCG